MRFYWLEHGKERKVTAKSGPTIRASQAAEKRRMAGERAEKHPYKGLTRISHRQSVDCGGGR